MLLSNSQKMRDADSAAVNINGIPSAQLMRAAARHLADAARELAGDGGSVLIFCGSGNNGGDGVAAAMFLMGSGCRVRVLLVGSRDKMSADTAEMERRLTEMGGRLEDFEDTAELRCAAAGADAIIDAIFGTGLSRAVSGRALEAVRMINAAGVPVVSADIPSGVDADTGQVLGEAVRADVTVAFAMAKIGHFAEPGCTFCGRVITADIGIPQGILAGCGTGVYALYPKDAALPPRPALSHKGNYGRVLIAAGSVGYTGAPVLCSRAAVRCGAGLVYLAVPESIYAIAAVKSDEAMPFPLPAEEGGFSKEAAGQLTERASACDVCAIGPGLGRGAGAAELVLEAVRRVRGPLVLDADALYALSRDMDALRERQGVTVLTPHEGEFARMGGSIGADRVGSARDFARRFGCVLVLKGHRTLAAYPDGEVYISTCGGPGMAKGGSGDVLTGMIAAMLGQFTLKQAVNHAVLLHGMAGDICARTMGEYAMTATDIIDALPGALLRAAGEWKSGHKTEI